MKPIKQVEKHSQHDNKSCASMLADFWDTRTVSIDFLKWAETQKHRFHFVDTLNANMLILNDLSKYRRRKTVKDKMWPEVFITKTSPANKVSAQPQLRFKQRGAKCTDILSAFLGVQKVVMFLATLWNVLCSTTRPQQPVHKRTVNVFHNNKRDMII